MIIRINVLCPLHQHEAGVISAVIARREPLSVYAGYFMLFPVMRVVNDTVDTRVGNVIAGLEYIANFSHFLSYGD
jgi:hypothetical protein